MRDQPPSIQDGPFGDDPMPDGQGLHQTPGGVLPDDTAERLARDAWRGSTDWLNSAARANWADSLRAFQSVHPSGSKYLSGEYSRRSRLFMPKTRTMVRRDEASTAAAFFANDDVVSVRASNDDDPNQQASAEVLQELMQHHLTTNIPWFLTVIGARQDCDVMGACALKVFWKYEEKKTGQETRYSLDETTGKLATDEDGALSAEVIDIMETIADHPEIELLALENIRFDPAADWRRPVETSPYVLEAIPMYAMDVFAKIDSGEWMPVGDGAVRGSSDIQDNSTRNARENGRQPAQNNTTWRPRGYEVCWIQENIIKWGGQDWHFFTLLKGGELLSKPRPLHEVYLSGERPYVVGNVSLEAHKNYPASKVELSKHLQWAVNDDVNLRYDMLKMSLHPRQQVKTGAGIDLNDLRVLVPGRSVMVKNPGTDIMWDRPPPPPAEAYAEQDRLNLAWDDLTGAFSNSSVQASQIQQQSATGMHMMSGEASGVAEYELRVFAETAIEPVLRKLVKLIQAYETDPVLLSIAGNRAKLFTKYGVNQITDELLNQSVTTKVNVGIGATNPVMKLQQLQIAVGLLGKMFGPTLVPGLNFEEITKEVMSLAGYKDGARFFVSGFDPHAAMQQQHQGPSKPAPDPTKLQTTKMQTDGKLTEVQMKGQIDKELAMLNLQSQRENDQAENFRAMLSMQRDQMKDQARAASAGMRHPLLAQLT